MAGARAAMIQTTVLDLSKRSVVEYTPAASHAALHYRLQGKCEQTMALYADCGKEVDVSDTFQITSTASRSDVPPRNLRKMFAVITKVEDQIGPIGLFVANAGIGGGSPGIAASDKEWSTMGGVNTMQVRKDKMKRRFIHSFFIFPLIWIHSTSTGRVIWCLA